MYQKAFGKENIYLRTHNIYKKRISEDELGCEDLPTQGRGRNSSSSSSSNLLAYTLHTLPQNKFNSN